MPLPEMYLLAQAQLEEAARRANANVTNLNQKPGASTDCDSPSAQRQQRKCRLAFKEPLDEILGYAHHPSDYDRAKYYWGRGGHADSHAAEPEEDDPNSDSEDEDDSISILGLMFLLDAPTYELGNMAADIERNELRSMESVIAKKTSETAKPANPLFEETSSSPTSICSFASSPPSCALSASADANAASSVSPPVGYCAVKAQSSWSVDQELRPLVELQGENSTLIARAAPVFIGKFSGTENTSHRGASHCNSAGDKRQRPNIPAKVADCLLSGSNCTGLVCAPAFGLATRVYGRQKLQRVEGGYRKRYSGS